MKIHTGDTVQVIYGKDVGKTGKVERVNRERNTVVVSGVAESKKHVHPSQKNQDGGIISFNRPIDVSNVMLVCPACGEKTRVGYQIKSKGKKVRVCKKCGKEIK